MARIGVWEGPGRFLNFCRTAHPDGPFTPAREGGKDVFPRTAFIPHLEQLYIVFYPWKLALLWLQRCLVYLRMFSSVVIDIQCARINREVKLFRDRWQFELKIVHHINPDLGAFEETLNGPLLILGNWYHFWWRRRIPRSPWSIVLLVDEGRRTSVIILRLRLVNLNSRGR